jgi:hypothetical protein
MFDEGSSPLSNALQTKYQSPKGTIPAKRKTIKKRAPNPRNTREGFVPTAWKKAERKCPPRKFGTMKVYPNPQNPNTDVRSGCRFARSRRDISFEVINGFRVVFGGESASKDRCGKKSLRKE